MELDEPHTPNSGNRRSMQGLVLQFITTHGSSSYPKEQMTTTDGASSYLKGQLTTTDGSRSCLKGQLITTDESSS